MSEILEEESENTTPTIKIALIGTRGVGRTSCLLRFSGVTAEQQQSQQTAETQTTFVSTLSSNSKRDESCNRIITVSGMKVRIRIVSPELANVSQTTTAISLRNVDCLVGIWSSQEGIESLNKTTELTKSLFRHLRPQIPERTLLLCNLFGSSIPKTHPVSQPSSDFHYHSFVSAAARSDMLLGPRAFDNVLRFIVRLCSNSSFPLPLLSPISSISTPPTLLEICSVYIRENWKLLGYSSAHSLPSDLHSLVLWSFPKLI